MIQTREEFIQWVHVNFRGVDTGKESPLWIPEHDLQSTLCGWFVTVRQIRMNNYDPIKSEYWLWCSENLTGYVRCFWSSSDDDKECWGFTNYNDIPIWILKWKT